MEHNLTIALNKVWPSEGLPKESAQFGDLILIELMQGKKPPENGSEIPFFKGGVKTGTVRLDKQVTFHCNSKVWTAKIPGDSKFAYGSSAIAAALTEAINMIQTET